MSSAPIRRVLTPALNRLNGYRNVSMELVQAADAGEITQQQEATARQQKLLLERTLQLIDRQTELWTEHLRTLADGQRAAEEAVYDGYMVDNAHYTVLVDRARETLDLINIVLEDADGASTASVHSVRGHRDQNDRRAENAAPLTVKLPKLVLPTFGGEPLDWEPFWQQFNSTVGSQTIPAVQKLAYLRSCLKDAALRAVEGYGITEANYQLVTDALKERFGKQRIREEALQSELINLRRADESTPELRRVSEAIEKICMQLVRMGQEENNPFILTTIKSKLPRSVLTKLVEAEQNSGEEWTASEYRQKLKDFITIREEVQRCTRAIVPSDAEDRRDANERNRNGRRDRRQLRTDVNTSRAFAVTQNQQGNTVQTSYGKRPLKCLFCQGAHWASECTTVSRREDRMKRLAEMKRCFACLRPGHVSKNCKTRRTCRSCNENHHVVLCPTR